MARISPFDEPDPWRIKEARNQRTAFKKYAPGVWQEVFGTGNERREWIRNPAGVMVDSVVFRPQGPLLYGYLNVFAAKFGMALFREHVGVALPMIGGTEFQVYLNAGLAQKTAEAILQILPLQETLKQGQFAVADQFGYRFNTDGKTVVAALASFHKGLHIFSITTSVPETYKMPNNQFGGKFVRPGELIGLMPKRRKIDLLRS